MSVTDAPTPHAAIDDVLLDIKDLDVLYLGTDGLRPTSGPARTSI